MILSYSTHKKWSFSTSGIKILSTQSTVAYRDLVQGFQGQNDRLVCIDDKYEPQDISKTFDFGGDLLLSGDVTKKYLLTIGKTYLANIDEDNRNQIMAAFQNLEITIENSLLLEDLPLAITWDEDLKKLLKMVELHLDTDRLQVPYGIIETVLKIHQTCNLKTIPVFCNVANYLDDQELAELSQLVQQMGLVLFLIEFTSADLLVVPEDAEFYYIDRDLVDWY
ncbi:type II-A CRISPR-associated protein Csn2 [Lactobacillus xylocopicola]|uniref:Type II-A CRISPR-associated protein Csn2 n=1 Tax=Lactobacillus xylocopicola TaxID=2976676 RepID=A0ABM8BFK5_9LACO|nr:type II-A CRISPR-associated protein Csn2 [Lactobacillus xylocopicola]BDR59989.1 hypothetical protein KIM322_02500 [Lactobacillus xylocopicola]